MTFEPCPYCGGYLTHIGDFYRPLGNRWECPCGKMHEPLGDGGPIDTGLTGDVTWACNDIQLFAEERLSFFQTESRSDEDRD